MNPHPPGDGNPAEAPLDPLLTHAVAEFRHEAPLTTLRVSPTAQYIAAGAQDQDIQLWNLADGRGRTLKGHDSWVRSIDFSADGTRMITACWGGVLKIWDLSLAEPAILRSISAHEGSARWVRVSPDGQRIATCGNDLLVKVWNAADGKLVRSFSGHACHVYGVDFHPSADRLLSQDLLGVVKIWNLESGKEERTIDASMMTGYDKKFVADMGGSRDLHFHADGTEWASAGITKVTNAFAGDQDPLIVVFDWKTGKATRQLTAGENFKGIAWGVRFHPGGFIVGAGAHKKGDGELWFYKPGQEQPFHTVPLKSAARAMDLVGSNRLAVAHADGYVRLYRMAAPVPSAIESSDKS